MDNRSGRKVSENFSIRWDRCSISGNKIPLQSQSHKDNDCQVHESLYRHNSKIRKNAWMQMQMRKFTYTIWIILCTWILACYLCIYTVSVDRIGIIWIGFSI